MRPMIGVVPLWDEERDSLWMLPGYMEGILQSGGMPVMLPLTENRTVLRQLTEQLDGFLFTGGQDVSPHIYGEKAMAGIVECCPHRDAMETALLHQALCLDKPVFGICRGIQFLNTYLGGTLFQDLPSQYPSGVEHHQKPPYEVPCHKVDILTDSPLYELLNIDSLSVNSYHHQAVKALAPSLCPMAVSEDGLTEAVYMPQRRFVWAVQWHPEFSFASDETCRKLFQCFVTACVGR